MSGRAPITRVTVSATPWMGVLTTGAERKPQRGHRAAWHGPRAPKPIPLKPQDPPLQFPLMMKKIVLEKKNKKKKEPKSDPQTHASPGGAAAVGPGTTFAERRDGHVLPTDAL